MPLLSVLEAPHPILSSPAREVGLDEFGPDMERFVSDMAETMYAAPGVGLAAPQVGDGRRILVANLKGDVDADSRDQFITMINPTITNRSDETIRWDESCLSVPDFELDVDRSYRIRVRWKDASGVEHEDDFEEFAAVVLQHEMDHLDGVTLLDRSSRLKRSRYLKRRKKLRRHQE